MKKSLLIAAGVIFLLVGLFAVVIIIVGFDHKGHVVLDGPSMEPTIHNGQNLTVTQYSKGAVPKRGNIVEYRSSNSLVKKQSTTGKLIHRIIALPGERITISNGKVSVFNAQSPGGFSPDNYSAQNVVTQGNVDTTLAPEMYFVMGDNRPEALDSRTTGPVSIRNIIGKITY